MMILLLHAVLCGVSFTLGFFVNPLWFWIPLVLGLNLIQSAFTDFCPLSRILGGKSKSAGRTVSDSRS